MTNSEFTNYVRTLLKDLLGYYSSPNSQELALSFDNKPRDVTQTIGLECLIAPKFISVKTDGGIEKLCDAHTLILIQNPQDEQNNISQALLKLQYNFLYKGRIDEIVIWSDADSSQGVRRVMTYTVFLAACPCFHDPCVAALFDDPLTLY